MTITIDTLILFLGLAAGLVATFLRIEHRLTRLETRISQIPCLASNPKKCFNPPL